MYRYIWKIKLNNPTDEEGFIQHWRKNSSILQEYPGAKGSYIHKVRGKPGCFFMVAEWESQSARDAMHNDIHYGNTERAKRWRKLPKSNSFGQITTFAGTEFDNIILKNI